METLEFFQPLACMEQPTGLIFHYTDLDVLLDCVIKKGTLKAGHIRFSNDAEEYIIGRELFCKIERGISKTLPAIFATCFSHNCDSRAMWSEYIRSDCGVSIGFDFETGSKTRDTEKIARFVLLKPQLENSKEKPLESKPVECYPYNVRYIFDKVKNYENSNCKNKYTLISGLKKIFEANDRRFDRIFPYIKSAAFAEEAESRIVFNNKGGQYTEFFHFSNERIPIPYLLYSVEKLPLEKKKSTDGINLFYRKIEHIRPGETKLNNLQIIETDIPIEHFFSKEKALDIQLQLNKLFKDIFKDTDSDKKTEVTHEIYIPSINCDSIPEELDLQNEIQYYLEITLCSVLLQIKIWQLGRLPIRKIIVMRCPETDRIVESLKCKFATIPWLKYVSIKPSSIPYSKTYNSNKYQEKK